MALTPEFDGGVDISLLKTSLAITPWERMRANDDALKLAKELRYFIRNVMREERYARVIEHVDC